MDIETTVSHPKLATVKPTPPELKGTKPGTLLYFQPSAPLTAVTGG